MKLKVHTNYMNARRMILNHFVGSDVINDSQVDDDTLFIVLEKFFFRNSSRASLSIVISQIDELNCFVEAVGSGGGQGMIFKFDWGAKGSFENSIADMFRNNQIQYLTLIP